MAYTALYRKFRPATFEEVKGQEHIVTTLKNQIEAGRIGHAYLFCGTRGTGKTSVAKIFAKAINCEHPVEGSPCGKCEVCRGIKDGTYMNVIEIDAASNNGVDNIRQIREEVTYRPTEGKYKVYIIDEVHMLSQGAFNALLKTLEEPPSYVVFILATTEAHKIPVTILSRCQRYDFHRITSEVIGKRLAELMEKEQIEAEEKALHYIAKKADGAMRDALSLLDQCIAYYIGETLTYDKVLGVLGAADVEVFRNMVDAIKRRDVASVMRQVEELVLLGRDLGQFVGDFTWHVRNLLLLKSSDNMEDVLDVSTEESALLKEDAKTIEMDRLLRWIRITSELENQMKYATQKRILLEVTLIKMCQPAMESHNDSLIERIRALEEKVEQGVAIKPRTVSEEQVKKPVQEEKKEQIPQTLEKPLKEDLQKVIQVYPKVKNTFTDLYRSLLATGKISVDEKGDLVLVFPTSVEKNAFLQYTTFGESTDGKGKGLAILEEALELEIGKEIRIKPVSLKEGDSFNDAYMDLEKVIKMDITIEGTE